MSLLFIDLDFISWLQTVGGPTQIPMSQPSFEFLGYKVQGKRQTQDRLHTWRSSSRHAIEHELPMSPTAQSNSLSVPTLGYCSTCYRAEIYRLPLKTDHVIWTRHGIIT